MTATNVQRILVRKAGGFENLELATDAPKPLGPDEVRIAVDAAGVNYADAMVRRGLYATAKKYIGWPITPGFEVAGRVIELAPGITDLQVGDRVMGLTLFGGYASEVTTARPFVFKTPDAWSSEAAAAFPTVYMTAWFALCELAHPRPGATILVHSAAGGVGTALARLGKLMGCTVVGVVGGSHKIEAAKAAGCDHVIDKSKTDLWREAERISPRGYDVICDANGVETLGKSYDHLAPVGRLVVYGFSTMIPKTKSGRTNYLKLAWDFLRTPKLAPLDLTNKNRSVMAFNLSDLFSRKDLLEVGMRDLFAWVDAGKIPAAEPKTYPLAEASEAHRAIESGNTTGKLVLVTA